MFDGGFDPAREQIEDVYAVSCRERDWMTLHESIVTVGKQIASLEAQEVDLLLEAEETRLYRRMGFATIYAYIEAVLGLSHHAATERMRVAHELLELPGIQAEFRAGEMPWTSVRELTRVATRNTEGAWLDAVEGKRSDQVQQMVRGKGKGDLPGDPVDPKKLRHRVVFDNVSPEVYMMYQQARIKAAEAAEGVVSDDECLKAYVSAYLEPESAAPGETAPRPRYQTSTTTCRECKRAHRVGAGMEVEMSPQEVERALCDAEDIGDLERDDPTRLRRTIPEPTRRKVWVRDKACCTVPGCRSKRFLEIHHIKYQDDGGGHQLWNLTLLCGSHHDQQHDGTLSISGRAPDLLVFDLPLSPRGD